MKHLTVVCVAFGLSTAPAAAQDFLSELLGRSFTQQQTSSEPGRSRRSDAQGASFAIPANARSFEATASYYGGGPRRFEPNAHTASGERFNQWDMTAAHRTLPIGTRLLVSHGGRSVVVRVNDRGPAAWTGRSLDLSRGAATRIGLIARGAGSVQVKILE